MVHYYLGDDPAEVLDIEPATVDLADYGNGIRNEVPNPRPATFDGFGGPNLSLSMQDGYLRATAASAQPAGPASAMMPRMTNSAPAFLVALPAPGQPYRLRMDVRHSRGLPVLLRARLITDTGATLSIPSNTPTESTEGWTTAEVVGIVPAGAVSMGWVVGVPDQPMLAGDTLDVRHVRTMDGPYQDGDSPGWAWEGTPHASPSAGYLPATVDAVLESPTGVQVALPAEVAPSPEDGQDVVRVTMLAPAPEAGVHRLVVTLTGAAGVRTLAPIRVPVELPDGGGWYTLDAARADWTGAPEDDARLFDLLDSARVQVLAYAPPAVVGTPVPGNYRQAQLMQARNIWNAGQTDPNASTYGGDGFSVPVYPLDWSVRQMIRPRSAATRVG